MLDFTQAIIDGIAIGSLYALIAIGYSMVFGVLQFVNFAHGELFMLGAYFVMLFLTMGAPLWVAILFSLLSVGTIAVVIERIAYKPLRKHSRLAPLITAVAMSLFLQNIIQVLFSPNSLSFPINIPGNIVTLGELFVRIRDIGIFSLTLLLAFLLELFLFKTKAGTGIRALAMHADASKLCGVPFNRTVSLTFFIGAVLAVIAGTIQGMATNQIFPLMGVNAGLKAFAAAVLGGIGEIRGAVLGGLVLGISESMLVSYGLSTYKDGFAFVILILVLLIRPQGILGRTQLVKV
ncbi:branched-chain amino acid ABC transporter permease [Fluviispira multicolorata]|uniref:Branched-chain amino acid ABC transporter permease n=1 Tax=Fluviispira multicolorata TaxID=2654512 RepID=A0A833N757_9BACT|nr:branched-chain amino acid ABC transporter permease [Fluviispira multicolorata]KAB8031840.1 branched-chain amino acid ABC transporter permease [Fluviispira multicolorata]